MESGAQTAAAGAEQDAAATRTDEAGAQGAHPAAKRSGAQPARHGVHASRDERRVTAAVARVGRDLLPALAVYVAVRAAGLIAIVLMARQRGVSPWPLLQRYDAAWLVGIARNGYDPLGPIVAEGRAPMSNTAFFPLYPGVVKVVGALPGLDLTMAALVVTALAGLVAAAGLDQFGRRLAGGRVAGLVLVALWAAWPHSVVLVMAYSEALFVALVVWSLVALLNRHWLTAGVLCLLAGATRPFGLALAAAIAVAVVPVLVRAVRDRTPGAAVRPVVAAVIAPLGQLGYWGWLWLHTGRPDAWFHVQSTQWRSHFDGGVATLQALGSTAVRPTPLVIVVCLVVVVAAVVLLVALAVDGAPLPVLVYSAVVVLIVVGDANYHYSKSRFLLGAFPLLLVLVRALKGVRLRTLPVLLTGLVLVSSWYNAYVLVFWGRSP
jgi:hypothetical protein